MNAGIVHLFAVEEGEGDPLPIPAPPISDPRHVVHLQPGLFNSGLWRLALVIGAAEVALGLAALTVLH